MNRAAPRTRVQVEDAVADLATLHSDDPAARHAVHAIKLTRLTLESFWLDRRWPSADGQGPAEAVASDVDDLGPAASPVPRPR